TEAGPEDGMAAAEMVDAFLRILAGRAPQVVVAKEGFEALRGRNRRHAIAEAQVELRRERRPPAAAHARRDLTAEYVPPANAVEAALAAIWQQLLGYESVGVDDNYFELGGDSILAVHVASRAREAGIDLTPGQIVAHQTIASLARAAGAAPAIRAEQG